MTLRNTRAIYIALFCFGLIGFSSESAYSYSHSARQVVKTQSGTLVRASYYNLAPSQVPDGCQIRRGRSKYVMMAALKRRFATQGNNYCLRRQFSSGTLNLYVMSAQVIGSGAQTTCRYHAVVYVICKRRELQVTNHTSAGYASGRMGSNRYPCSTGQVATKIARMAKARIQRMAGNLCRLRRLPRVRNLRITRTFRLHKVITRRTYLCSRKHLYSFTCSP